MDILQGLVENHLIPQETAKKVRELMKASGKKAEEILLEEKFIEEKSLFTQKSEMFKIPLREIKADGIPLKVLERIPEDSARYYKFLPLSEKDGELEIGMVYPEDAKTQEVLVFLARQGNFSYTTSLISPSVFEALLKHYRSSKGEVGKALQELEQEIGEEKIKGGKEEQRFVEDAPVTKMVAVILRNAVEGKASDIHIEPLKDKTRVRFRFLGQLHPSLFLPSEVHQSVIARIKILANLKIDETRIPQDGRFSTIIDGRNIDFRVATFPTTLGEKVAIRVLDPEAGIQNFEDLGLQGENLKKVKEAIKKPYGLVLVTGPTGSGKSTTLYALLKQLNQESVNIISLEDPVEYFIKGVNQSQVRPEIGYDFAQGLRQILRQDPNVIMVGEVRDKETAFLVIHAALTGHIVLSTLHANNAVGVATRLIDMGIDRYLIPTTLNLAMSQRLIRRLCDQCKEKVVAKKEIQALITKEIQEAPASFQKDVAVHMNGKELFVFQARGCKLCNNLGYSGRVAIFEILVMTEGLAEVILKEPSEAAITKEAKAQGMITLRQDGILKVLDGITTIEEVLRVTEKEL